MYYSFMKSKEFRGVFLSGCCFAFMDMRYSCHEHQYFLSCSHCPSVPQVFLGGHPQQGHQHVSHMGVEAMGSWEIHHIMCMFAQMLLLAAMQQLQFASIPMCETLGSHSQNISKCLGFSLFGYTLVTLARNPRKSVPNWF